MVEYWNIGTLETCGEEDAHAVWTNDAESSSAASFLTSSSMRSLSPTISFTVFLLAGTDHSHGCGFKDLF